MNFLLFSQRNFSKIDRRFLMDLKGRLKKTMCNYFPFLSIKPLLQHNIIQSLQDLAFNI